MTGLVGLEKLRDEWTALWERCPRATPFQHPDWLLPYCRPFGVQDPWAVLLRRRERLVGIAPLVVYRRGEERVATLLGTGISDYQDVLLEPDLAGSGAEAILEHLARHRDRWDVCELEQLREESPLLEVRPPNGWREQDDPQDVCPVLRLPAHVEELSAVVSPSLRDNLRYYRRRAERLGPVRFESATDQNLDELVEILLRLHRARWAERGQEGMIVGHLEGFHREVARRFLARGVLRLDVLRIGDRAAAAYYGFLTHGRAYYYLGGFEPALKHLSVGTLVVGRAIEQAVHEGAAEFDFLRGREAYKYAWGAADRPVYRRRLDPGATERPPAARATMHDAARAG